MKIELKIEERRPIWIALSDLYVDNELQDLNFNHIAAKIKESPYTFNQVKEIDRTEVFPILYKNLLSVAGNWTGFEEKWLVDKIAAKIQKRNFLVNAVNRFLFICFGGMNKDYWKKLQKTYLSLND